MNIHHSKKIDFVPYLSKIQQFIYTFCVFAEERLSDMRSTLAFVTNTQQMGVPTDLLSIIT